jgi:hypothetical protein
MNTTLDLRPLPESERNDRVNEAVAVHVAKDWREVPLIRGDKARGIVARFQADQIHRPHAQVYTPVVVRFKGGYGGDLWPRYATSANDMLPLLEKHARWEINFVGDTKWKDRAYCCDFGGFKVMAPTLPLAACLALLRANGVEVLT